MGALLRIRGDQRGVSAIEFALLAPVMLLLLVAAIDFGMLLSTRLSLTQTMGSASNLAIVNADKANAAEGDGLAAAIAAQVPEPGAIQVVVNNGPSLVRQGGATQKTGTASRADSCYCPRRSEADEVEWGSAATCGSSCSTGGLAGKFVFVAVAMGYQPIFSDYGMTQAGQLVERALVQVD